MVKDKKQALEDNRVFIKNRRNSLGDWRFYKNALMFAVSRLVDEGLTAKAASLSYTSITSAVPLLAVVLSLFTAMPFVKCSIVQIYEIAPHYVYLLPTGIYFIS